MSNTETLENSELLDATVQTQESTINIENQDAPALENTPSVAETVVETPVETPAAEPAPKAEEPDKFDILFKELQNIKENNGRIEVQVQSRIRGGLRVTHKNMPMFLPASHFNLKRNPPEEVLLDAIGKNMDVMIHELQEDETKRKTVVVSRKQILESDFWENIRVGDIVEGPVSSIASFGIFIDLGGAEGLVHVSRLSQQHVTDTKTYTKKGEVLKAKVVEVDKERNRIALSRKEFDNTPWKGIAETISVGTKIKGIVRRITDFGAYIEIKKGVDGLLRNGELSWTKRFKSAADIINLNQEIELEVISLNEDKQSMTLSLKRMFDNPWNEIAEKFAKDTQITGKVKQIVPQGCIISLNDEVDGFMPRSKMKGVFIGKKSPFNVGEDILVTVTDIDPAKETLIIQPVIEQQPERPAPKEKRERRDNNQPRNRDRNENNEQVNVTSSNNTAFTLGDLLSDKMRQSLLDNK